MKKITIIICMLCAAWVSYAQPSKGDVFGNLKLGVKNTSDPKAELSSWSIGIAPSVDWFVTGRFSIGLGLGFDYGSTDLVLDIPPSAATGGYINMTTISKKLSLMPRASYHIPLADKFTFSFTGTLGFSWYSHENKINDPDSDNIPGLELKVPFPKDTPRDTNSVKSKWRPELSVAIVPAINYFINNRLVLSLSVGSLEYVCRKERGLAYDPASAFGFYSYDRWASDFYAGFGQVSLTLGVRF